MVKDWVRRGAKPGRLELDFGGASLKAFAKILPALRLCQLPAIPDQADLDILVKTDVQGNVQSERYCLSRRPDHSFHQRPPLEANSLRNQDHHADPETPCLVPKYMAKSPSGPPGLPGVYLETPQTIGQEGGWMLLPKGKGKCGRICTP